MEYTFSLEKYKGPASRHTCPQCGHRREFARYVDGEGSYVADHVGRCNRIDKCGYHVTPKQYFEENPGGPKREFKPIPPRVKKQPSFIPVEMMKRSRQAYDQNNFVQFLLSVFDPATVSTLIGAYHIGTSKHWPGANIFWQIDNKGNVRSGKIMLYSKESGRRSKVHKPTWAHTKMKDFILCQCLFGLHQIIVRPYDQIAVCESEKTAVIASAYLPDYVWMATGGKENLAANDGRLCEAIKGKRVTLFPDLGAYKDWKKYGDSMGFATSDILERHANDDDRNGGFDLADFLLRYSLQDFKEKRAQIIRDQWEVTRYNEPEIIASPPQPEPPQVDTLPDGKYYETLKDGRTILMCAAGYPDDWNIPAVESGNLPAIPDSSPMAVIRTKYPHVRELMDRLECVEGKPEGRLINADFFLSKPLFMASMTVEQTRANDWKLPTQSTHEDYFNYKALKKNKTVAQ